MFLFTDLISKYPLFSFSLYLLFCIFCGMGLFGFLHYIRLMIHIRNNKKARLRNDKLN